MSKRRFLPDEVRNKLIDCISETLDFIYKDLDSKYRIAIVSDAWTDTKLVKNLETFTIWSMGERVPEDLKKRIQGLKEEIAEYILLEEIQSAKQKSSRD